MLFTFPSRYWFAIGLLRVFSLGGWSRRIHTGFLVSRATQESATLRMASCTGLSPSLERFSKRFHSPSFLRHCSPTTPTMPEHRWFGLFPVRSPLLGESLNYFLFLRVLRCFSSPRSLTTFVVRLSFRQPGCPIRKFTNQRLFAPPRDLSQLITSFIACKSLGIHRTPFLTCLPLLYCY